MCLRPELSWPATWNETELTAFYNTSTVISRPSVSPWEPRMIARSPFLTHQFQENQDGRLITTRVFRKPTHTDQYLAYDSHHLQSVNRGSVCATWEAWFPLSLLGMCSVDDTFTILDRDRVDSFLQHLNSQQPTVP